ncbi:MAG: DUF2512 family protein [Natronincolaceae bacterium]|nr:DUF2512 family protein [Bacillota bacterium]NLK90902.1 DUF2512 family protein [Clostridiales bacterium]
MSKTTGALLFKFLMTLVVSGIAFNIIGGNTFGWVFLIAILGTVIDYLAGDLLILPKVGSFIGAIINGVLAALIAIVVAMVAPAFTITTHSVLAFAVLVAVGEYFFHQYLLKADKVEP